MAGIDQGSLINKVRNLSDLELATLLCLVAGQHCIIETEDEGLNQLAQELGLVCQYRSPQTSICFHTYQHRLPPTTSGSQLRL